MKKYFYHDFEMILYQYDISNSIIKWGKENWNLPIAAPTRYQPSRAIYVIDFSSFMKFYKRLVNKRRKSIYIYSDGRVDSYEWQKKILTECFSDVVLHRTV